MKSKEFVDKAKELASHKTIYVKDCPGVYMNQQNKLRYAGLNPFNSQRSALIFGVSDDTFGLDEIGLINTLTGSRFKNIGEIVAVCNKLDKDFSTIKPGELVFSGDAVGVYIGDSDVIAVTSIGVTKVSLDGWKSHGYLNTVEFFQAEPVVSEPVEEEKTEDAPEVKEVPTDVVKESRMEVRPDRARRRH